jgi:tetratricopeptide (TPR) repeat protein
MLTPFDVMKAATCRIDAAGAKGTGYLVSASRIVTCHHVIERAAVGEGVSVVFPGHAPSNAVVTDAIDPQSDAAVLDWRSPVHGIVPLRFAKAAQRRIVWEGYGYPGIAQGLPIEGTVDDLAGTDTRGIVSFVLTADKLGKGTGAPPHGFSGSPVMVNGFVVGHLKRILEDPDFKRHVAYGTVYAARAEDFLKLLPGETLNEAVNAPDLTLTPVATDGFEVLLSAAARDLPRAARLAEALKARARRVYFPTADVAPGQSFGDAVASALTKSRAALILMTRAWFQDSKAEAEALWARRDPTFPLVPVLIDDLIDEVPAPWDNLRPVDLRGKDFAGPGFERLLYALEGKTAPYEIVAADLATALGRAEDPQVTAANAKRLISVGNPRKALEILDKQSSDLQIRRLRALALAKSGKTDEAITILKAIQAEGALDVETGGILGGRYRQKWETTKRREFLTLSLAAYRDVFERFGDPYPGINTAALMLQLGDQEGARAVATRVLEAIDQIPESAADHWTHAAAGEAWIIRGDLATARAAYERAVLDDVQLVQDVAVMRRGARCTLRALGADAGALDAVFAVPRPVAFVGHGVDLAGQETVRFPRSAVGPVRAAIKEVLERRSASLGIASATVGGDTLFIQGILDRDGFARVLLPCPEGEFLKYFVVQRDRLYDVRKIFGHERAEIVVVARPADPADVWSDFGPRLRDHATEWARSLDEEPLLVALWDGQPSFVSSVIELWQDMSFEIELLSLRNGGLVPGIG